MDDVAYFEVCQKASSTLSRDDIEESIECVVKNFDTLEVDRNLIKFFHSQTPSKDMEIVKLHIDSVRCSTRKNEESHVDMVRCKQHKYFIYTLNQEQAATETMQHESEELNVASHIILPSVHYEGLWESLYYNCGIKDNLLNYIETTITFSERKVDPNVISWNKVILLYGPPGTGKTSLCQALAQKAAIRFGKKYSHVELVEINSHSLFSKWFSESGKLVMKLFDEVRCLLENSSSLICLLIDEVESLAHARKSCTNGTEPSDAIRVVNALLTQLDQIKSYPNVLILTTSNVTEAIDLAFVDRADIKQYIGHPNKMAILHIYCTCLRELIRARLISRNDNFEATLRYADSNSEYARTLQELSETSSGFSGRALKKIPFLAYAMYAQTEEFDPDSFLDAMRKTIEKHKDDSSFRS